MCGTAYRKPRQATISALVRKSKTRTLCTRDKMFPSIRCAECRHFTKMLWQGTTETVIVVISSLAYRIAHFCRCCGGATFSVLCASRNKKMMKKRKKKMLSRVLVYHVLDSEQRFGRAEAEKATKAHTHTPTHDRFYSFAWAKSGLPCRASTSLSLALAQPQHI